MTTTAKASQAEKPVRLEINTAGAWRVIGRFDAADEEKSDAVLDAAEHLAHALGWNTPERGCPALRVSADAITVLMRWTRAEGWRDARTGEPA